MHIPLSSQPPPLLLVLLLSGCARETPDTGLLTDTDTPAPAVAPTLSVTSPARATFAPDGAVRMGGSTTPGSAPLATLTLDSTTIPLFQDGTFDSTLSLAPGVNILGLRLEDTAQGRAVDGRAVYAGPLRAPGAVVHSAARIQLGPELLDDNDPDPDDIAGIVEQVLEEGDISSALVGIAVDAGFATITPTALSFASAAVDIVPRDGHLEAAVVLSDVWMDFDADDILGFYSTTGAAWVERLTLAVSLEAVGTTITATDTQVSLEGYGLTVDWFPDWLEDDLADWTQETLEEELALTTQSLFSDVVNDYLGAFGLNTELLDGVFIDAALVDLASASAGLRLTLDVALSAPGAGSLPSGAGSMETDTAGPGWPAAGADAAPFWVAVDDDMVNQLLFSLWASGALEGFVYTGDELAALSGAALGPPLGPVAQVSLGMRLPPSLHAASVADMDADLALGEWQMDFRREDGAELSFSVNVRTGAVLSLSAADEIVFALDSRPANMVMAVGTLAHPAALDPGDLAALIKLMVPPLVGGADQFLPGIVLPPLDLGLLSETLAGTTLTPQDLEFHVGEGAWLLLSGRLGP